MTLPSHPAEARQCAIGVISSPFILGTAFLTWANLLVLLALGFRLAAALCWSSLGLAVLLTYVTQKRCSNQSPLGVSLDVGASLASSHAPSPVNAAEIFDNTRKSIWPEGLQYDTVSESSSEVSSRSFDSASTISVAARIGHPSEASQATDHERNIEKIRRDMRLYGLTPSDLYDVEDFDDTSCWKTASGAIGCRFTYNQEDATTASRASSFNVL